MSLMPIRFPLTRVKISGDSMAPRFKDGRVLLFQRPPQIDTSLDSLIGKVVLVMRESYPGVYFIKRVKSVGPEGLWVEGDNLEASTDSRAWGHIQPEEIVAVAFRK